MRTIKEEDHGNWENALLFTGSGGADELPLCAAL